MKKIPTKISDVFLIENFIHKDNRGSFIKTFNEDTFKDLGISVDFKESFYSVSSKDVLRGMHYQQGANDCTKLISLVSGKALLVILDINIDSKSYGQYEEFTLNNETSLLVAKSCAVGFLTKEDNTIINYLVSKTYSKEDDKGIKWDSFGFKWTCEDPILSERDKALAPFKYEKH